MGEATSGGPVSAGAEAAAGAPETARYEQDLSRSIGVLGNVFITLSGVTPASSVFIIVPVALVAVGSGSFLSYVFAAIVGVFMAFCWAELSAAYRSRPGTTPWSGTRSRGGPRGWPARSASSRSRCTWTSSPSSRR
jgi:amino acid transporter